MSDFARENLPLNAVFEAVKQPIKVINQDEYETLAIEILKTVNFTSPQSQKLVTDFFRFKMPEYADNAEIGYSVMITQDGIKYLLKSPLEAANVDPGRASDKDSDGHVGFAGPITQIPVLDIQNPRLFLQGLDKLLYEVNQHRPVWTKNRPGSPGAGSTAILPLMWYNATPYDFRHPLEFIDRVITHIKDERFANLSEADHVLGNMPAFGAKLTGRREEADSDYEAPYYLVYDLIPPDWPKPKYDASELPAVRYGMGRNTAYIYAVQMLGGKKAESQNYQDMAEHIEDTAKEIAADFKLRFTRFPEDYRQMFGEIPAEIMELGESKAFIAALYKYLATNNPMIYKEGYQGVYAWVGGHHSKYKTWEEYQATPYYELANQLTRLKKNAEDIVELPEILSQPEYRKRLLRTAYRLDEGVAEGDDENIFRPAILSLTATLKLLKSKGIKEIVVPTYLPLRWQSHVFKEAHHQLEPGDSERIQFVTTNKLIRLCQRVAEMVDGVSITSLPDDDGFLRMKFNADKELKADNPLLQELLEPV